MESEKIILISSDKLNIEIDKESAKKSITLEGLISGLNKEKNTIELPNIKGDILKKIVDYLIYYKDKTPKEIPKPLPSSKLNLILDEWDNNYINNVELENIFDLLQAADYLGIATLVELCSAKLASLLRGKTEAELRSMFNNEKDLSEEEVKKFQELEDYPL